MKRYFIRLLSGALALLLVYGGKSLLTDIAGNSKAKKITGTYVTQEYADAETAETLLVNYDFYPEEIALVDLNSLHVPKYVNFSADKHYSFYYDTNEFRSGVEDFFRGAFDQMYAGRGQLSGLYQVDFSAMTQSEFQEYYAALYGESSFDSLISVLANDSYDYNEVAMDKEVGTFTVEGSNILCTISGHFNAEAMGYKLSGNTLTLTFSNTTQIYTQVS